MSFFEDSLRRTAAQLYTPAGRVVTRKELLDLGWDELVAEEPIAAITTIAEAQGRNRGSSRLVELEMARCLGLDSSIEALAFPLTSPPGDVDAVLVADAVTAPTVVIPIIRGGPALGRVPAHALTTVPVGGIDPDAAWTRIRAAALDSVDTVDPTIWSRAVAAGRLALAHELIGVGQAMLDLAVLHVTDRHQFGVPLGTFQAVQHRLAEVHVQLEAARAIARTAWIGRDQWVCAAALFAGRRAVDAATEHCHQVMGALGCTWEHDLHRFIRRGVLLSLLLDPDRDLIDAVMVAPLTEVFA
jgi:hypothetical protein